MGLKWSKQGGKLVLDLEGKSVLDIGCGPVSMLLKTVNGGHRVGIDPCNYPDWIKERYHSAHIGFEKIAGEDLGRLEPRVFDEVWIYNCLQHVKDPELIINNAKKLGKVLRIFEWVGKEENVGHPHVLQPHDLQRWIGAGQGNLEVVSKNGCYGIAYSGEFKIQ